MFLPLKAVIKKKPKKNGLHLIYFQYCFSSTNRILLGSGIAIPAVYWNKKRQQISNSLPPQFGNVADLNSEIGRMFKVLESIIENGVKQNLDNLGDYVKTVFTPQFNPDAFNRVSNSIPVRPVEPDLFEQIEDYIRSKEKRVASVAVIRAMKERLIVFQQSTGQKLTFSKLDFNFYTSFVDFLAYDIKLKRKLGEEYGLKLSTIGSTIKNLRVFLNDRMRRKIILPIDLSGFKILDEESDAIYLSYKEIETIYKADLSAHPHLIVYRDLFVFGCLTGLRFSDYSNLDYTDFRNGMLYKKMKKTNEWVVIPLRKGAVEIFMRHLSAKTIKFANPMFNRLIKDIAKMAGINQDITFSYRKGNKEVTVTKPKAEWVTSHTCRRSFCTNEYLAGTEINLIMKISGHKTHKDFFKYIKIGQEEAALQIQRIWEQRNNMGVF